LHRAAPDIRQIAGRCAAARLINGTNELQTSYLPRCGFPVSIYHQSDIGKARGIELAVFRYFLPMPY
jgi:hypothetical protein